ncbi:MAG: immunoglobulin domain-containing protein [Candidatus Hydrogenedens sp.]|nr:immunoglobulin domain-containing protein [Candidatus Hydrogenedens sp.]
MGKTLVRRKLNERAEFTVLVTGAAGNPQYQWSKEVFSKADKAFSDIPGADGPTYVINGVKASDEGRYVCRVTDSVTTVYGPVYTLMLGSEPVTERVPAAGMTGLAALAALLGACGAAARRRRK